MEHAFLSNIQKSALEKIEKKTVFQIVTNGTFLECTKQIARGSYETAKEKPMEIMHIELAS